MPQLQPIGRLPATTRLRLTFGLPLRNQEELGNLLHELYDPASPNYRHYLTPEEFTERFGPTKEDYQAVIDFAKAHGLAVVEMHPNRVVLVVEGTVADIEKTLHVALRTYQHPKEARTFYAPDVEPSLDLAVPVLHISGLNNYSLRVPRMKRRPANVTANAIPQAGTGPGSTYIGNDFRTAYGTGANLTGAGQSVGLLQFDGYYPSDIATYTNTAGIHTSVILTNVPVGGGVSSPGDGNGEVSLDIQMVISMAPGVSKIYVYEAPNDNSVSWAQILSAMASNNVVKQFSCSWGDTSAGSPDPTSEAIFQQMAAQGQSFFNASGDSDAFTVGSVPFPSESTNITQVGGTTLTTGSGATYSSETVWNWGGGTGSSGGVSGNYTIPNYQLGISMTANKGSTTMRNVPDVALTADNVYNVADNGATTGAVGGTSCAAPLWAGFTALVNQQAAANGQGSVGFLNPALYTIGKSASYSNCFHDTTTGNNGTSTKYPAVSGYDLCTGWGTPNGTNLINALAGAAQSTPSLAAKGSTLTAESCSPTNGFVDPGETVTVSLAVTNSGTASTVNLVGTLLATNGVTSPSSAQTYGAVTVGHSASRSFTLTATGTCGGNIIATLQLQDGSTNYGNVTYTIPLGQIATPLAQNFDGVTAPALPTGWATSASGGQSNWVTSTASFDSSPNAAFSADNSAVGVNELDSPSFAISSANAQLTFRQYYNLTASASNSTIGYDGGVLEIKIGAGAYTDILTAGGSFSSSGYNRTLSSGYSNPLAGRQAWSGDSSGFVTSTVNLPASAAGQTVQLRWRCGAGTAPASPNVVQPLASSGTLAYWSFDSQTPTADTNAAHVVFSDITTNNLTAGATFTYFQGNPSSGYAIAASGFTTSPGPPNASYGCFAFSMTVSNGYQASLSSISLDTRRSTSGVTNFSVQASHQANFSSWFYDSGIKTNTTTSGFATTTLTLTNSGLTGTVYFRIYGYANGNSGGIMRIDNLNIQGSVNSAGPGGWYVDTVSVSDPSCCSGTPSAPVALFTGSPTNGPAPLTVTFTDSSTGSITNRFWNFGDTATSNTTATTVAHVYSTAGTYPVTLIVFGPGGSSTNIQANYITATTPCTPPTAYSVTGGGSYCSGGGGVAVGLAGSQTGVNYQLYNGASIVGAPLAGTGSSISFGHQTAAGTYTTVGSNTTTACTQAMTGSATVTITTVPGTPGTITQGNPTGSSVCANASGVTYTISSVSGATSYTWTVPSGASITGGQGATSITVTWGTTGGNVTVTANNTCGNSSAASLTVSVVSSAPAAPTASAGTSVTGSGFTANWSAAAGATGYDLDVATDNGFTSFVTGYNNLDVGNVTSYAVSGLSGGTPHYYRVRAYNPCGTSGNSNTQTVTTLAGSQVLASWDVSSLTGGANSFGPSPYSATIANTHVTVGGLTRGSGVSTNGTAAGRAWGGTVWTNTPEASAISAGRYVTFTIHPNSGYIASFSQVSVFSYRRSPTGPAYGALQWSTNGVDFTDINNTISYTVTSSSGGQISPIDLTGVSALQSVPDSKTVTFRIVNWGATSSGGTWYIFDYANNTNSDFEIQGTVVSSCTPPTATVRSADSTSICGGSSATIHADLTGTSPWNVTWLDGASGTNYTQTAVAASPATRTVSPSATTTYTVTAVSDASLCSGGTLSGSATVTINPLPTAFTVTGGGAYCSGSVGVAVGLSGSQFGVNYQLYNGASPVGSPAAGTGGALSFGNQTAAGTYTVAATDGSSGCTASMTGNATVTVNPTPGAPSVGSNSPINAGDTLNLTASTVSGAAYNWTGPNSFGSTAQNPSIANATTAASGLYQVTVTVGSCTSTAATTSVTVNALSPTLAMTKIAREGNDIRVTWIGTGGNTNQVQVTPGDPGGGYTNTFTNLGAPIILPGTSNFTTNYLDQWGATNKPSRYYRVRLVP